MRSVLVRQKETGIFEENGQPNPCLNCPGFCCAQNLINVCGYDVWVIARGLHIKPTDFLAFADLTEKSPYDFILDSSGRAYCLALNMKELPDGSHRCTFALELPNHQVRCGIYSFRPVACQSFPLAFDGEEVTIKPWFSCPDVGWNLDELSLPYWREELGRHDMEFSIYGFVVAIWNKVMTKQPKLPQLDFRPFLNFLMNFYQRLEVARGAVPDGAWSEIWKQWRQFTADGSNPLFLKVSETVATTGLGCWLQSIQKTVMEVSQDMQLQAMLLKDLPEEKRP